MERRVYWQIYCYCNRNKSNGHYRWMNWLVTWTQHFFYSTSPLRQAVITLACISILWSPADPSPLYRLFSSHKDIDPLTESRTYYLSPLWDCFQGLILQNILFEGWIELRSQAFLLFTVISCKTKKINIYL